MGHLNIGYVIAEMYITYDIYISGYCENFAVCVSFIPVYSQLRHAFYAEIPWQIILF